jgi:hypothetical protein
MAVPIPRRQSDKARRFGVAGLSREGMSAIETAVRENASRYHFEVVELDAAGKDTPAVQAQPGVDGSHRGRH